MYIHRPSFIQSIRFLWNSLVWHAMPVWPGHAVRGLAWPDLASALAWTEPGIGLAKPRKVRPCLAWSSKAWLGVVGWDSLPVRPVQPGQARPGVAEPGLSWPGAEKLAPAKPGPAWRDSQARPQCGQNLASRCLAWLASVQT